MRRSWQDGLVTVDMGVPRFDWDEIPLSRAFEDTRAIDFTYALPDGRVLERPSVVNVGNPHCIFWVQDAGSYDLAFFGGALEHRPAFSRTREYLARRDYGWEAPLTPALSPRGEGVSCGLLPGGRGDSRRPLSPRGERQSEGGLPLAHQAACVGAGHGYHARLRHSGLRRRRGGSPDRTHRAAKWKSSFRAACSSSSGARRTITSS